MATKVSDVGRGIPHPAAFDKPVDEGLPLETPLVVLHPPDHPQREPVIPARINRTAVRTYQVHKCMQATLLSDKLPRGMHPEPGLSHRYHLLVLRAQRLSRGCGATARPTRIN